MASGRATHRAVPATPPPAPGGMLSTAVTWPAVSLRAIGILKARTCSARSNRASTAASLRGSLRPAKTRPNSWLVRCASSRRWRATPQASPSEKAATRTASPTTAGGPARRKESLRDTSGRQAIAPHVGDERGRQRDRAVGLLAGLEQRGDGARQRHTGGIEGVHELRLGTGPRAEADVGAARLEVGERAGARHLEPRAHARCPSFQVVGLGAREPGVAGREQSHAVGQLEPL